MVHVLFILLVVKLQQLLLVPRPPLEAFFAAVEKPHVFSRLQKKATREATESPSYEVTEQLLLCSLLQELNDFAVYDAAVDLLGIQYS